MTRTILAALLLSSAAVPAFAEDATAEPKAKNVILFIGDGMGISTIHPRRASTKRKSAGRPARKTSSALKSSIISALVKTYNTNAQVPDSAGTATAMHSGVKTRIGVLRDRAGGRKRACARMRWRTRCPLLGEEVKQRGLGFGNRQPPPSA